MKPAKNIPRIARAAKRYAGGDAERRSPERTQRGLVSACAGLIFAIGGCVHGVESAEPDEAQWDRRNVEALLAAVDDLAAEGLSPDRYDTKELEAALDAGMDEEAEAAASSLFSQVAADLTQGVISPERRARWAISGSPADPEAVNATMETALRERRVAETIAAFAPNHPQYALLKAALAKTDARSEKNRATAAQHGAMALDAARSRN
jgi:murein L,D-transpeptidase YcbB/YkuD